MMFMLTLAAAMMLQASAADRNAFVSCLKGATVSAKAADVGIDDFKAYAHKTCAAAETSLKSKLAAFNVKNGMSRNAAAADAQLQLEDYLFTAEDNYRYSGQDPD